MEEYEWKEREGDKMKRATQWDIVGVLGLIIGTAIFTYAFVPGLGLYTLEGPQGMMLMILAFIAIGFGFMAFILSHLDKKKETDRAD